MSNPRPRSRRKAPTLVEMHDAIDAEFVHYDPGAPELHAALDAFHDRLRDECIRELTKSGDRGAYAFDYERCAKRAVRRVFDRRKRVRSEKRGR